MTDEEREERDHQTELAFLAMVRRTLAPNEFRNQMNDVDELLGLLVYVATRLRLQSLSDFAYQYPEAGWAARKLIEDIAETAKDLDIYDDTPTTKAKGITP